MTNAMHAHRAVGDAAWGLIRLRLCAALAAGGGFAASALLLKELARQGLRAPVGTAIGVIAACLGLMLGAEILRRMVRGWAGASGGGAADAGDASNVRNDAMLASSVCGGLLIALGGFYVAAALVALRTDGWRTWVATHYDWPLAMMIGIVASPGIIGISVGGALLTVVLSALVGWQRAESHDGASIAWFWASVLLGATGGIALSLLDLPRMVGGLIGPGLAFIAGIIAVALTPSEHQSLRFRRQRESRSTAQPARIEMLQLGLATTLLGVLVFGLLRRGGISALEVTLAIMLGAMVSLPVTRLWLRLERRGESAGIALVGLAGVLVLSAPLRAAGRLDVYWAGLGGFACAAVVVAAGRGIARKKASLQVGMRVVALAAAGGLAVGLLVCTAAPTGATPLVALLAALAAVAFVGLAAILDEDRSKVMRAASLGAVVVWLIVSEPFATLRGGGDAKHDPQSAMVADIGVDRDAVLTAREMLVMPGWRVEALDTVAELDTFDLRPGALDCIFVSRDAQQATQASSDLPRLVVRAVQRLRPRGRLVLEQPASDAWISQVDAILANWPSYSVELMVRSDDRARPERLALVAWGADVRAWMQRLQYALGDGVRVHSRDTGVAMRSAAR